MPKIELDIIVEHKKDGRAMPKTIVWDDGRKFNIDKILDIRRAACQSVGGVGDRYTCRIQGQESYLWYEKGRWFVAAKK